MRRKELKLLQRMVKVNILSSNSNIVPLAYLMAKAHGLTEYEKTLEESI